VMRSAGGVGVEGEGTVFIGWHTYLMICLWSIVIFVGCVFGMLYGQYRS
jgi:hypothetical protein